MSDSTPFALPETPSDLSGPVKAWRQPVVLETYEPEAPNRNPMFLESRVYQGSSGKVYPLPFIERIAQRSQPREWDAFHIENEYVRVMILPELGGRIHVGLDKTNGYDFFYRQNVIKPALVGLAGPWASGGVEFNWPQHHRPATYMPVEASIEWHADGAVTIWCSDHDPFERLKGTHGICLHPGKAILELKVRLYNRTPLTQTFLWWANAATRVHELYQSFFPPDVHFVADHAKRAMSTYPLCTGTYYGVDYARRAMEGVPEEEKPAHFVPPGMYAVNDLRWYANIPVPTSYMALGSEADFFGGYDHRERAGVIHVADHHIAPGKKQWTWGNHEFGYSWDRHLTDRDGPYIELMAGVFTDNQPDFSFLAPGESRVFSQFWYPIQEIGIAHAANTRAACHVERVGERTVRVALYTTERMEGLTVRAIAGDGVGQVSQRIETVAPGGAAWVDLQLRTAGGSEGLTVKLSDADGGEILRYVDAGLVTAAALPFAAQEPVLPSAVDSVEELVLIGQHLEQYRHATRDPVAYWREGLRRDPGESRCHEALGLWHLRRGEFAEAERHLLASVARLTLLNPNPAQGSAFYHLGLVRRFLRKEKEAYDAFSKATWNYAVQSAAHHQLGEMDAADGKLSAALDHLERALSTNRDHLRARNLMVVLLRKVGRAGEAERLLAESYSIDPTDIWTNYLRDGRLCGDNPMLLDLALDYWRAGLCEESLVLCAQMNRQAHDGGAPMVSYVEAFFHEQAGHAEESRRCLGEARAAQPDLCFPSRLEELLILEWAIERDASDSRARYYLGNLLYDKRRYPEAIEQWEQAGRSADAVPTVWRNLGIAYYNVKADTAAARMAYEAALALDPTDARVFYERDQLWKRTGTQPAIRLSELQEHSELVETRDDLSIELIALLNQNGEHAAALEKLKTRWFQPWEGGEGLVMEQHVRTHVALGRQALLEGQQERARAYFVAALGNPHNLGEARHLLANRSNVYFWLGEACSQFGSDDEALQWWRKAVSTKRDFQQMSVRNFSAMSFYRVLSFARLGLDKEAGALRRELQQHAAELAAQEPTIDYFATSLPNTLLFREDLRRTQRLYAQLLQAQVLLAAGQVEESRQALADLLAAEPSYAAAADLLEEAECLVKLQLLETAPVQQPRRSG